MTFRWKIAQAAEIRWWQRYLKNKSTTDYSVWKMAYWQKLLAEIGLSDLTNESNTVHEDSFGEGGKKNIFDAGCGPAGIFMIFKNQKVDALDPLLDKYEASLPHFKKTLYPNVQFFSQPLEHFDKKEAYDAVFCLNAINHVADLAQCFDILVNATKKGGKLIVSIDAHNYSLLKHIFQALPGDVLHPHQYDLTEYQAMLTQRGCTIDKTVLKKKEFIFNYYILVATKN
ncbi:MAG: class I SAM-dependent methyltransferase [Saprospiraceae bacterium]|nr:class I SAM-dependent methyltransferase [Saprospiraceae bacterium]